MLRAYLLKHNQRFAIAAQQPGSACQPLPHGCDVDRMFSFHYTRRVANDHTIALDGQALQLPPAPQGRSYVRASVDIWHSMDGRLAATYQDQILTTFVPAKPGPPRVAVLCPQTRPTTPQSQLAQPVTLSPPKPVRSTSKPATNHPWRRGFDPRSTPARRTPDPTPP